MSISSDELTKHVEKLVECDGSKHGKILIVGAHALIIYTLVYCLWERSPMILSILLSIILMFLSFSQKRYPIHFFILMAILLSSIEFILIYTGRYPWKYQNTDLIPLWKVPLWGLLVFYIIAASSLFC